jgi:HK97 family phage major capsid protein
MPPLTTRDFDGVVTPADVQLLVVNKLLGGAPFARSLDPLPTNSGRVSWPTAAPTGGGWTAEGAALPVVDIDPGSYTVVAKKLAGVFELTSEMVADASFNIAGALGQVIADRLGVQLDDGLIRGGGDPEDSPVGVWGIAPAVDDAPLWPGIWSAVGDLGDAGGQASHVALKPSTWADEAGRTDDVGRPLYPDGLVRVGGLNFVKVPSLAADECLVYDANQVRLIVRRDFGLEADKSAGFARDVVLARIIGRFAVGVPVANKGIRKLTIAGSVPAAAKAAPAATARAK